MIAVRDKSRQLALVLEAVALVERDVPDYLETDHHKMTATFVRTPALGDVPYPVQMEPHLVVEFYAKTDFRRPRGAGGGSPFGGPFAFGKVGSCRREIRWNPLEKVLFASRWIMAPMYLGLVVALGMLMVRVPAGTLHLCAADHADEERGGDPGRPDADRPDAGRKTCC